MMLSAIRNLRNDQRGVALVTALLVTMLMAALLVGFTALVASDSRRRGFDRARSQAFYAAHAGLEQLTADLGDLFSTNFAPSGAEIAALTAAPPALPDTAFVAAGGGPGYTVQFPQGPSGDPIAENRTILSGPWQGFIGLVTPYQLLVTARLRDGSEASLTRTLQTVSIPVFQFGIFSESALSFFAGPNFNFGGRVHTNDNLFLASGSTLTLSDRVTAVEEVVRTTLSNGWSTSNGYTGTVAVLTAPGAFRPLAMSEGSLIGGIGTAENEPTWSHLSAGTYNHHLSNGRTGARRLDLPLVSFGAEPVDLIRRPQPGEDVANPSVFTQRYFSQASIRILLSDTPADMLGLPGVSLDPPVLLGDLAATPVPGYAPDGAHPPFAVSSGVAADGYRTPAGTPTLGGYLKIERQTPGGAWQDVTLEMLSLGVAGRNIGNNCPEPNPDAVIRLQRIRDNPTINPCGAGSVDPTDYWPNALYDTREGDLRDGVAQVTPPYLGGVMHYVELDVRNLTRWLQGAIGASGANTLSLTGYVVYFSDRRGNRNALNQESAEYGCEDVVNPDMGNGWPNGLLDTGEDANGNGQLDTYGQNPIVPPGSLAPLDGAARPWTAVNANIARVNRAVLFRRALKLVHGDLGNLPTPGLTVVAENPVYIEGHYNANALGFGDPHAAAAVIGDAVTLLSADWNDRVSFTQPHNPNPRNAVTTWYRLAVIAGKPLSFPRPNGTAQDFGTDGGVHNFLRYLENWNGRTLNYRGAIATLFTSRQAVGTYKCCAAVYNPPARAYVFDTDFLQPSLLPPRTPMFRDVNTTGFTQVIRP